MTVVLANPSVADPDDVDIPRRTDGQPYPFEMIFDGFGRRAYADTPADLLAVLIPDYLLLTSTRRLAARLRLAADVQVHLQAQINTVYGLDRCTPEEYVVLNGHRNTPPEITSWSSPVPLVLIDTHYRPQGDLPRPYSALDDTADPINIVWLRPAQEYDLLVCLHQVGHISLNHHVP